MTDPRPAGRRARLALVACAAWSCVALALLVVALALLEIDPVASVEAGRANGRALRPFWAASAAGWLGLTALWIALARRRVTETAASALRASVAVLAIAAAARAAVLVTHEPALSDDVYRYVFDGRNLASGFNPYAVVPEHRIAPPPGGRGAAARWPGEAEVAARVNNPELATIYLPTSQWAFGATGRLLGDGAADPLAAARAFRAAMVVAELLAIGVLLALVARAGLSPWWTALYAWHPLAVTEVAGSGHHEPIGLLALAAALLWWAARPRRVAGWTALLAVASLVKPVVIPVAALLLRGRPWRTWLASGLYGAVVCLVIAAPLMVSAEGDPIGQLRRTAVRFTLKWTHFAGVYEPLLAGIERLAPAWTNDPQERLARAACGVLLAAAFVAIYRRRRMSTWLAIQTAFLAMVLLTPAAHPWYLLWGLLLAPLGRSVAVWIASLTVAWGYAAWSYLPADDGTLGWGVRPWLLAAAWAPVYVGCVVDWRRPEARRQP